MPLYYRRGGGESSECRCAKPGDQVTPLPAIMAICWPAAWTQRRHGGADGRRGVYSKARADRCNVSVDKGFSGGHGIVGRNGPARHRHRLANKYRGNDNVSLTYFGDGRQQQGQVYESFKSGGSSGTFPLFVDREQPVRHGNLVASAFRHHPICPGAAWSFDVPGEQVDGMDGAPSKAAGEKR